MIWTCNGVFPSFRSVSFSTFLPSVLEANGISNGRTWTFSILDPLEAKFWNYLSLLKTVKAGRSHKYSEIRNIILKMRWTLFIKVYNVNILIKIKKKAFSSWFSFSEKFIPINFMLYYFQNHSLLYCIQLFVFLWFTFLKK